MTLKLLQVTAPEVKKTEEGPEKETAAVSDTDTAAKPKKTDEESAPVTASVGFLWEGFMGLQSVRESCW